MTSTTQTKISSKLYREAAIDAQVNNITVDEQVALWARVGKAALDNSDLPVTAIKDILIAQKQVSEPFSLRPAHT